MRSIQSSPGGEENRLTNRELPQKAQETTARNLTYGKVSQQKSQDLPSPQTAQSHSTQSTSTGESLKGRIKTSLAQMHLNQVARGINRAVGIDEENTTMDLPLFGKSMNPVTRLEKPAYLPITQIESHNKNAKANLPNLAFATLQQALNAQSRRGTEAEEAVFLQKLGLAFKGTLTNIRDLTKAIENFEDTLTMSIETTSTFTDPTLFKERIQNLAKVLQKIKPEVNTLGARHYFAKDEIVSHVRTRLASLEDKEQKALIAGIRTLNANRNTHVTAEEIEGALGKDLVNVLFLKATTSEADPFAEPLTLSTELKAKFTPHYLSTELQLLNEGQATTLRALREKNRPDEAPSMSFKWGNENAKEILGTKILPTLSLNSFVLPKAETVLENTTLNRLSDPIGIGGDWIEGTPIDQRVWYQWLAARHEHKVAEMEGRLTPASESELAIAKQKVIDNFGSTKSVGALLLNDLVMGASDSHILQFVKNTSQDTFNIDFSRFLALHDSYQRPDGKLYATFRSDLLDHPIAEESIAQTPTLAALKEKILSWDINEIQAEWKKLGLLDDGESVAQRNKTLTTTIEDLQTAGRKSTLPVTLDTLAKKYGLEDSNLPTDQLKAKLSQAIKEKIDQLELQNWQKIHPQAFDLFSQRITSMQKMFEEQPDCTLKELWHAAYPTLSPFYQALDILSDNPGSNLLIDRSSGGVRARSLESIVAEAKESPLISTELLQKLEESLVTIQKESPNHATITQSSPVG